MLFPVICNYNPCSTMSRQFGHTSTSPATSTANANASSLIVRVPNPGYVPISRGVNHASILPVGASSTGAASIAATADGLGVYGSPGSGMGGLRGSIGAPSPFGIPLGQQRHHTYVPGSAGGLSSALSTSSNPFQALGQPGIDSGILSLLASELRSRLGQGVYHRQ